MKTEGMMGFEEQGDIGRGGDNAKYEAKKMGKHQGCKRI